MQNDKTASVNSKTLKVLTMYPNGNSNNAKTRLLWHNIRLHSVTRIITYDGKLTLISKRKRIAYLAGSLK